MTILKAALGFAASAYVNDTVVRPRQMGKVARDYCDRARKPLLLVACRGLTEKLLGVPVKAEVTTNRAYPVPVRDKHFGAVMAVGVLERLRRPEAALREWRRVADRVFIVVPSWFSPHAWLDPSHRWMIDPKVQVAAPLWNGERHVRLLEVSDSGYGTPPWNQRTRKPLRRPRRPSQSSGQQPRSPSQPHHPSPYGRRLPVESMVRAQPDQNSSGVPVPDLRSQHSGSSNSASHLMVVSTPDFEESW